MGFYNPFADAGWLVRGGDMIPSEKPEHLDPIIVLGAPRSGTSAVAGILHNLGVFMAKHFGDLPDKDNPRGYYEDRDFIDLHTARVCELIDDETLIGTAKFFLSIRRSLNARYGWKELRTINFYHIYKELCPNAKVIYAHRADERKAISSISEKFDVSEKDAQTVYYTSKDVFELQFMPNFECASIKLEDIRENPIGAVMGIAKFCDIEPTKLSLTRACAFVYPKSLSEEKPKEYKAAPGIINFKLGDMEIS